MCSPILHLAWIAVIGAALPSSSAPDGGRRASAAPIDFASVPRTIGTLPKLVAEKPLYGLFVFGAKGETRVWAVLDKSNAAESAYDVLHLDVNANGDLTEGGERFEAETEERGAQVAKKFSVGRFVQPGTPADAPRVHTDFSLTWSPSGVFYKMKWNGGPVTMGCYGPDGDSNGRFGEDPKSAPIVVPGHDLPFQFETWLSRKLARSGGCWFKVFVGNRGSVTGAFSCVDDKFLMPDEHVIATLIYKDRTGKERSVRYELRERC